MGIIILKDAARALALALGGDLQIPRPITRSGMERRSRMLRLTVRSWRMTGRSWRTWGIRQMSSTTWIILFARPFRNSLILACCKRYWLVWLVAFCRLRLWCLHYTPFPCLILGVYLPPGKRYRDSWPNCVFIYNGVHIGE